MPTRLVIEDDAPPADGATEQADGAAEQAALRRSFAGVRRRLGQRVAMPEDSGGDANPDEPQVVLDDDGPAAVRAGARVDHTVFGAGTVVRLRGAGRHVSALVRFDDDTRPRIIIPRHLELLADEGSTDEVRVVLDEAEGE